jgi:tripartite-type tricarboxylate transporter receptor subunit TctC
MTRRLRPLVRLALGGLLALAGTGAQAFPDRPLTLVVGFPAGGAFDSIMRTVAEEMSTRLGQRVNVDNRAGAGGALATQVVLSAKPDGHTLLAAGLQLATGPHLNKVAYDPQKDLRMVAPLSTVPVLLLAKADSPIKQASDITALARRGGQGLTVGSGGVGTTGHFGSLMLGDALGVKTVHVPFKGGAGALQGLAGGEVDLVFDQMSGTMQSLLQAGRIRALAVMQGSRLAALPQLPTAAEFGLKLDAPLKGWQGLAVRAATPAPVVARLQQAWQAAAASPAVKRRAEQLGLELMPPMAGDAFQQHYLAELARWGAFITQHKITAD